MLVSSVAPYGDMKNAFSDKKNPVIFSHGTLPKGEAFQAASPFHVG